MAPIRRLLSSLGNDDGARVSNEQFGLMARLERAPVGASHSASDIVAKESSISTRGLKFHGRRATLFRCNPSVA